jgi:hypothetical protein
MVQSREPSCSIANVPERQPRPKGSGAFPRLREGTELALVLPKRPPGDMISLLESLGVGCVVKTAPGAFVDATSLKRCPSSKSRPLSSSGRGQRQHVCGAPAYAYVNC